VPSTPVLELSAESSWQGGMRTRIQVREFPAFFMDEPKEFGGKDSGPNPMEYLLGSLLGCSTVMTAMIARELHIDFESIGMQARGTLDTRGLGGEQGVSPYFQKITQTIDMATSAPKEQLDHLAGEVARRCPAYNLLQNAGVVMEVAWARKTGPAQRDEVDLRVDIDHPVPPKRISVNRTWS